MRRSELLLSGQFLGLPKDLARAPNLTPAAKLVWAVIADRLGKDHETAWPGIPTIPADAGISESTAKRAVDDLEKSGWFSVRRQVGKPNVYTVLLPSDPVQNDPAQNDPCQNELTTRLNLTSVPVQNELTTGVKMNRELPNITTELTTEGNNRSYAAPPLGAADAAGLLSVSVGDTTGGQPVMDGNTQQGTTPGGYGFAPATPVVNQSEATPIPAPAAATGPAPAPAKASRRARRTTTAAPLTDEEKAAILSSADAMERYLLWGKDALRGVPQDQLKVEGTNWRRHNGTPEDPKLELWDVPSFAGYYWFRVSKYREKRGILLTLPQWARLVGDMKNMLATMTKKDLHLYIGCVCSHFELIRFMCQRAGETMALNETSLSHNLIKSTAANIINMTDEQRGEKYAEVRRYYGRDAA